MGVPLLTEPIEPERSDPSGWIRWVALMAAALVFALVYTLAEAAPRGDVDIGWTLAWVGLVILAALGLPAWAIFGNRS